jgi:hypothetical protein
MLLPNPTHAQKPPSPPKQLVASTHPYGLLPRRIKPQIVPDHANARIVLANKIRDLDWIAPGPNDLLLRTGIRRSVNPDPVEYAVLA